MCKILIVDDEDFIRKAIVSILDWETIGFSTILEAEDGELAYEIAMEQHPDVILTDIRMPFMDGLELSQKISESLPNTKILILTGYDEFEYAKSALKIGVLDYIVKPIKSDDLEKVMIRTKNLLDREKKKRIELTRFKRQLRRSLPLLKEKFFHSLIYNKLTVGEIEKRSEYLGIDIKHDTFTVCSFETSQSSKQKEIEDIEINNISINNYISELVNTNGIVFNDLSGRHVLIYFNLTPNDLDQREVLHNIAKNIEGHFSKNDDFVVTTGFGNTVSAVEDIYKSYDDALHALCYKVCFDKGNIFDIIDLGYRHSGSFFPVEQIKELLSLIRLGIEYQAAFDSLFVHLYAQKEISIENLRIILYEIVNGIQKILMETESNDKIDYSIYDNILKAQTISEVKPIMQDFFEQSYENLHSNRASKKHQLIENAKKYIEENYSDAELNLDTIANYVYLSASYLSVLFKKETGENFIDYLTTVRMKHAKSMLRLHDFKTYEIAQKVGYSDPHYFSIVFKKYTSYTPSSFKQLTRNELQR